MVLGSEKYRVEFANTLRGFAALSVLIAHYFSLFWNAPDIIALFTNTTPFLSPQPSFLIWANSNSAFNWGAFGVGIFFIISGFVIPFSLNRLSWKAFCLNRIFRIFPVYFMGLSITLLAIWLGGYYFNKPWPFTLKEVMIHYIPGIRDLLNSRSIDGIIWTLEIEMKFYVLAALMIVWFRQYSLKVFLAPLILFVLALYFWFKIPSWSNQQSYAQNAFTFINCAQYIIFMFIGVAFHYIYQKKLRMEQGICYIVGIFILFALLWHIWQKSTYYVVSSYGFALFTFSFAYAHPAFFKKNLISNFFANISYPMYVVHSIVGYIALRLLLEHGVDTRFSLLIVCVSIFLLSWLLHRFVEEPCRHLVNRVTPQHIIPSAARSLGDRMTTTWPPISSTDTHTMF